MLPWNVSTLAKRSVSVKKPLIRNILASSTYMVVFIGITEKKNTFCSCHYPSHERSPFAGWPRGPAPLGCRPQNLYLLQKRAVRKLLSPKSAYSRRISPVDLDFILLFSTLHSSLSYYCFLLLPLHLRNTYNREKDFFFSLLRQTWLSLPFLALLADPVKLSSYPS